MGYLRVLFLVVRHVGGCLKRCNTKTRRWLPD